MRLTLQVLGPGCWNCRRLYRSAEVAAERLSEQRADLEIEIEKIEAPGRFLEFDIMSTPALAINGRVVSAGRSAAPERIMGWIEEYLQREGSQILGA